MWAILTRLEELDERRAEVARLRIFGGLGHDEIAEALAAFAGTESWDESIGNQDFYGWTGINPASDEEYDSVRAMIESAGLTLENLGE